MTPSDNETTCTAVYETLPSYFCIFHRSSVEDAAAAVVRRLDWGETTVTGGRSNGAWKSRADSGGADVVVARQTDSCTEGIGKAAAGLYFAGYIVAERRSILPRQSLSASATTAMAIGWSGAGG